MTIWFAQNSSVNIDSVNQWNDVADGSGNFLTFADLDPADILVANAKTAITINVSFTCTRITTSNADGGTAGGGFTLAAGVTVTANVVAGTTACVTRTAAGAESFVVGSITGGIANSAFGINNNSNNTISIIGNVSSGSSFSTQGVNNASAGIINITGNVTGGPNVDTNGSPGVNNASTGVVNITGNVAGGTGTQGHGVRNVSTGTISIVGDVTGGSNMSFGVRNLSSGRVNIVGDCIASEFVGAIENGFLSQISTTLGSIFVEGNFIGHTNGRLATGNGVILIADTEEIEMRLRRGTLIAVGSQRSLYTGGINLGQPAEANVRFGTQFGAVEEYTGTLRVPAPQFVSQGVLTDNTVGSLTAGLDESALHTALDSYTNKDNWKATGFPDVAAFEARTLPSADYFVVGDYTEPPTVSEIQSGLATPADVQVTVTPDITVNPTELSTGSVDAIRSGLSTLTAQQVWDYVITGSTSAATAVTNLISRILGTIRTAADDATAETAQTTAIRSGLATAAKQDTAKTTIDAILVDTDETIPATLANMSGATFDTATDSLEAIRDRGDEAWAGGGATVNVLPAVGIVADRSPGATISPVVGETISQSITLYQTDGVTPVDLSSKTLAIVFETMAGVDVAVVPNANITISGDYDNVVTFAYPSAVTASERTLRFAIKDDAAPLTEYLKGLCNVTSGPRVDA